jgi:hypothetical protein
MAKKRNMQVQKVSNQKRVEGSTHSHILFGRKKSMEEDEDSA